jgi:hypothetical protein
MAAAAVGAGYHQGKLQGFIEASVVLDRDTIKAGINWADMDFHTLDSTQQDRYLKGKPGPSGAQYSFGYYADNRYGTLSKAQDIGYSTLYTHGLNFKEDKSTKLYTLNGRECINSAYLRELGYEKLENLTADEKTELTNTFKTNLATVFGAFDNSVSFKIAGETIPNPRKRENNLSRNTEDCPAEWL